MRKSYTSLLNSATALITKFGSEFSFEREKDMSYDPATGVPTTRSITYTANAVFSDFLAYEKAGDSVQAGDIRLLAEEIDYKIGDIAVINCKNYRIVDIKTIQGSTQRLAVYLHMRQ